MEPYQRFMRANYVFTDPAERQKYLKRPITSKAPEEYSKRYFDEVPNLDEPTQLQYVDMHTWMIYDILLKADRMSMANSLELRVPFLDKKMLEPVSYTHLHCPGLPAAFHHRPGGRAPAHPQRGRHKSAHL